jgi:hypothetical protein
MPGKIPLAPTIGQLIADALAGGCGLRVVRGRCILFRHDNPALIVVLPEGSDDAPLMKAVAANHYRVLQLLDKNEP